MSKRPVLSTALCDMLGIEYPIMLAGKGTAGGYTLTAAVPNAGGLGMLGPPSSGLVVIYTRYIA